MRTSNPDRLTAATAEQLLDGGPGPAGLSQLLAAAAGPGTASELAGETAAVAAFVDAPRANPLPSAQVRRPSMLSTALSKILAAKALAAVVLLAGAGGGVALAANASSAASSDETAVSATATADAEPAHADDVTNTEREADAGSDEAAAEPEVTKTPSPEPSVIGLCRAWAAGATDNPGAAADNPAFRSLVEAAGSEEDVPGFCADREQKDQPGKSDAAPGHADDEPGTTGDDLGSLPGRSDPPTVAPGNADRPAGPPAGRATLDGAVEVGEDGDDEDSEDHPRGGKDAKQGGQDGGASGEHRSDG